MTSSVEGDNALTADERWLIEMVRSGRPADGTSRGTDGLPIIGAAVLREVLLAAKRPVGVCASNLRVTGTLSLAFSAVDGPISLTECTFDDPLDLRKMHADDLDLSGVTCPGLQCEQTRIQHPTSSSSCRCDNRRLSDA